MYSIQKTAIFAAILVSVSARSFAADVAADFSASQNPNGQWTFGSSSNLGGQFSTFTLSGQTNSVLDQWFAQSVLNGPVVIHNNSASAYFLKNAQGVDAQAFDPGQFAMSPGPTSFVTTRWTAPAAGQYLVSATFEGMQFFGPGATADVHVVSGGAPVFSGSVNGWAGRDYISTPAFGISPIQQYVSVLTVAAGDAIDFSIGSGNDGEFFDGVGLAAQITTVPEPGQLYLAIIGLIIIGSFRLKLNCRPPLSRVDA